MKKLFKSYNGKKIHVSLGDVGLSPRCHAGTSWERKEVFGEIRKRDLCKNCFRGMAPEGFGIDMSNREFVR